MNKLQNEYLNLAIGTSLSTLGKVDTDFIKAFLMGHIIGRCKRDITEKEMEFIRSINFKPTKVSSSYPKFYNLNK